MKNKYSHFFYLINSLNKKGFNFDRHEIVRDHTNGRTDSLKELSSKDYTSLIYFLKTNLEKTDNDQTAIDRLKSLEQENIIKKYRSIVLADAQYIGIFNPNNWESFNLFMKKRSLKHKPLKDYTIEELPALISQFKSMRAAFDNSNKPKENKELVESNELAYSYYFQIEKMINQKTGQSLDRKELISYFTQGRTNSLRELSNKQYTNFCNELKELYSIQLEKQTDTTDQKQILRRVIFSMARDIGMIYGYTEDDLNMNIAKLNKFLIEKGAVKKPIHLMNEKELGEVMLQFRAIKRSYNKK